ncbi:MAG: HXXEE domain-containing protein [Anaerolineales bacterium]
MHWFDVGMGLAVLASGYVLTASLNTLSVLLWANLIALFLHQFEEYRFPGTFPGMMNTVMFNSPHPDRYPLNTNTALVINVSVGWLAFLMAALLGAGALWLGIATMLVSIGNVLAHTFLFNIKGGTRYNPGMLTAITLFAPIAISFGYVVVVGSSATPIDWALGLVLGVVLNYIGILKLIDWLKDEDSPYVFPNRFLIPDQRI